MLERAHLLILARMALHAASPDPTQQTMAENSIIEYMRASFLIPRTGLTEEEEVRKARDFAKKLLDDESTPAIVHL